METIRRFFLILWLALPLWAQPAAAEPVEIRIVYDNIEADPRMPADWGFSAAVRFRGSTILLDAGADSQLFLRNLETAGLTPEEIEYAVISHLHSDHREGIYRLAMRNRKMKVFFLDSFPAEAFELATAAGLKPVRVTGPVEIAPGVYTTGQVDGSPPEQALVLDTTTGLVVLVGSSHVGVVKLVEAARAQLGEKPVRLLLGGIHMERLTREEILEQIARLRELGVEKVAPAHRTGETGKHLFRQEWGGDYLPAGTGRVITLE